MHPTNTTVADRVNLIVPLEGSQEMARLRYEVDQLRAWLDDEAGVEVEVALACDLKGDWSLRVPHGVLMISGRLEDVLAARRRLAFSDSIRDEVSLEDVPPLVLSIANSALDDDRASALDDLVSRELLVPVEAAGRFLGCSGRKQIKVLARDGVFVQIEKRILLGSRHVRCRLITATECFARLDQIEERMMEEMKEDAMVATIPVVAESYTLDWVISSRRRELEAILHKTGVFAVVSGERLSIVGSERSLAQRAAKAVERLVYECHNATIWNRGVPFTNGELDRAAQSSGAVLLVSAKGVTIQVFGTHIQVRHALSTLCHARRTGYQIKYSLTNDEDVREFVSGKKDGKLIKIMKETGVCMSLRSLDAIHRIEFELVGDEAATLLVALDMLMGESPAELSFYLNDLHHKRLIGHGGKTIQRVMKKHAVYIKFLSPEEALEQAGPDAKSLPAMVAERLPNVIVRTPAKNEAALEAAREEIYEMAEEEPADVETESMSITVERLLLDAERRREWLHIMREVESHLDLTLAWGSAHSDASTITLEAHGSRQKCTELLAKILALQLSPNDTIMHTRLASPASPKSVTGGPDYFSVDSMASLHSGRVPASPTTSTASSWSTSSTSHSWTCTNPEVFRHFDSPLLCHPNEHGTPVLSPHSPLLQEIQERDLLDKIAEFEPIVGTGRRRSRGPWERHVPRLSLMTVDGASEEFQRSKEDHGEGIMQMDWKAIAAEQYRRRASSLFSK